MSGEESSVRMMGKRMRKEMTWETPGNWMKQVMIDQTGIGGKHQGNQMTMRMKSPAKVKRWGMHWVGRAKSNGQ